MSEQEITKQKLIESMILSSIEQRIFKEGDRLLSVRKMAENNQMSITPVLAAYRHLEDIGVLEARSKSGFYVAAKGITKEPEFYQSYDFETDAQSQSLFNCSDPAFGEDITYRFSTLQMPPHLENHQLLFSAMSKAASSYTERIDSLCLRHDSEALTVEISKYLLNRKCIVSPDNIRLTFGGANALSLAIQACCTRGDVVAAECPGLCDYYFAAKLYGTQLIPISSNPVTGLNLDEFESTAMKNPRLRCVICAPNFSNPTGALMPDENKRRLADFCEKNDIVIIEVDFAGDFSHSSLRPLPLKSFAPEQVIYVNSLASSLTNVCFISGGKYHKKLKSLSEIARVSVPAVTQEALALYLQSYERQNHLQFIRQIIAEAARSVYTAVQGCFPEGTKTTMPLGGMHMWIELPDGWSSADILPLALEQSVSFGIGALSSPGLMFPNCIRLNIAVAAGRPEIIEGISILGKLLCENAPD